mmetsp:Transcript_2785/g.4624  ORF Transcript_2785/g.4624 Transcript_2785/m.4624 type:complete len:233 (-) Transcript_2785:24-722(-)
MRASSSIAPMATASSQRLSRRSRLASRGARSRRWPSTSMPRLASQAPLRRSRPRPGTRRLGGRGSASASRTSRAQPLTNWLWWAKPGSVVTRQPWACSSGTRSAWKSPKKSSCTRVHRDSPRRWALPRHCSIPGSSGSRPRLASVCSARASPPDSKATVTCSPRGPSGPRGRRPSRPSPRVRVRRVRWGGGDITTVSQPARPPRPPQSPSPPRGLSWRPAGRARRYLKVPVA